MDKITINAPMGLSTVMCSTLIAPAVAFAAAPNEVLGNTSGIDVGVAMGGLVVLGAGAAAAAALTDPSKRREGMMAETGGDEAASVRNYFDTTGFERWNKIYGETEDVNKVQLDIRNGHQQTVDKVIGWLASDDLKGVTVCDAGCGTGSLAIPLALKGASVSASDISSAMVGEAERRFKEQVEGGAKAPSVAPKFDAMGLEECSGKYDLVTCIDVMIHYPKDRVDGMIAHLAGLSSKKLIISFAPKTVAYLILKRIGELFPGPSKATRAYLHDEGDVEAALLAAGFRVKRREMTATSFYFSRLLECERV
jgi:magnesium-protoporphyrin O-methyltransferase